MCMLYGCGNLGESIGWNIDRILGTLLIHRRGIEKEHDCESADRMNYCDWKLDLEVLARVSCVSGGASKDSVGRQT